MYKSVLLRMVNEVCFTKENQMRVSSNFVTFLVSSQVLSVEFFSQKKIDLCKRRLQISRCSLVLLRFSWSNSSGLNVIANPGKLRCLSSCYPFFRCTGDSMISFRFRLSRDRSVSYSSSVASMSSVVSSCSGCSSCNFANR